MSRDCLLCLEDMQVSCKKLLRYADGLDFGQFVADEKPTMQQFLIWLFWARQPSICCVSPAEVMQNAMGILRDRFYIPLRGYIKYYEY